MKVQFRPYFLYINITSIHYQYVSALRLCSLCNGRNVKGGIVEEKDNDNLSANIQLIKKNIMRENFVARQIYR